MSDTNTTTVAPKPQIEIRPITRNEVSVTPVQREIKRGEYKGMQYITIEATPDNLDDVIKFLGTSKVCDLVNGRINLDTQETICYLLEKTDKLQVKYKINPDTGQTVKDANNNPVVENYFYNVDDLIIDEYYDLLTKGAVRGGVTIKDLSADNEEMQKELLTLIPQAMANPGDPSFLLRASELSAKIQENNEGILRIQQSRAAARAANKEEAKAA